MIKKTIFGGVALLALSVVFSVLVFQKTFAEENTKLTKLRAIGKIESIYRNRVSMQILKIIGTYTPELTVATGSWISYDLPKNSKSKKRRRRNRKPNIKYGSVVDVTLVGNPITEYEPSKDQLTSSKFPTEDNSSDQTVLMWTAESLEKIRNADDYLTDNEKGKKKGRHHRRHHRRHHKKKKKPVKTWTQEETVRGKIVIKNKRLYIREARVRGRRAKGLDVISDEWYEKLKPFKGQDVVVYGKTHRVNISSGTIEIESIMKIYPK